MNTTVVTTMGAVMRRKMDKMMNKGKRKTVVVAVTIQEVLHLLHLFRAMMDLPVSPVV